MVIFLEFDRVWWQKDNFRNFHKSDPHSGVTPRNHPQIDEEAQSPPTNPFVRYLTAEHSSSSKTQEVDQIIWGKKQKTKKNLFLPLFDLKLKYMIYLVSSIAQFDGLLIKHKWTRSNDVINLVDRSVYNFIRQIISSGTYGIVKQVSCGLYRRNSNKTRSNLSYEWVKWILGEVSWIFDRQT